MCIIVMLCEWIRPGKLNSQFIVTACMDFRIFSKISDFRLYTATIWHFGPTPSSAVLSTELHYVTSTNREVWVWRDKQLTQIKDCSNCRWALDSPCHVLKGTLTCHWREVRFNSCVLNRTPLLPGLLLQNESLMSLLRHDGCSCNYLHIFLFSCHPYDIIKTSTTISLTMAMQ